MKEQKQETHHIGEEETDVTTGILRHPQQAEMVIFQVLPLEVAKL